MELLSSTHLYQLPINDRSDYETTNKCQKVGKTKQLSGIFEIHIFVTKETLSKIDFGIRLRNQLIVLQKLKNPYNKVFFTHDFSDIIRKDLF